MRGWGKGGVRGKIAAFADEEGDEDFVVGGDLAEGLGEGVVLLLVEGVELLGVVDGDDGDAAAVVGRDYGWGGHGGGGGYRRGQWEEAMGEKKGSRCRDAHGDVGRWFWWLMEMAMSACKTTSGCRGGRNPTTVFGPCLGSPHALASCPRIWIGVGGVQAGGDRPVARVSVPRWSRSGLDETMWKKLISSMTLDARSLKCGDVGGHASMDRWNLKPSLNRPQTDESPERRETTLQTSSDGQETETKAAGNIWALPAPRSRPDPTQGTRDTASSRMWNMTLLATGRIRRRRPVRVGDFDPPLLSSRLQHPHTVHTHSLSVNVRRGRGL